MSRPDLRLERRYRRLLRWYPRAWRRHRGAEVLDVLLQSAAPGQTRIGLGDTLDVVGHGLEARADALSARLPGQLRDLLARTAWAALAGLSLVLLGAELVAGQQRPEGEPYPPYLAAGPVQSTGAIVYLGFLLAVVLVAAGRGGLGRLLLACTVVVVIPLTRLGAELGGPAAGRLVLLATLVGLAAPAALVSLRPGPAGRRRLLLETVVFAGLVAAAVAASRPALDWSVGTMTGSGNVALTALAAALPVVCVLALLLAARRPYLLLARAVTAAPLVGFSAAVYVVIGGPEPGPVLLMPVGYALAVLLGVLAYRAGRRSRSSA